MRWIFSQKENFKENFEEGMRVLVGSYIMML